MNFDPSKSLDLKGDARKAHEAGVKAKTDGNLHMAYACFQNAVQLDPDNCAHHNNLALTALAIVQTMAPLRDQAFHHAQHACQTWPDVYENWVYFAEICLSLDKYPEAIAAFEQAIEKKPGDAALWGRCGFAMMRNHEIERAIEYLSRSIDIDPEIGDFQALMGINFDKDHFNPEKQAYHCERAFTCKRPSEKLSVEAMWNAAHGYLSMGNYEKGWAYFEARHTQNLVNAGQLLPSQRFKQPMWYGQKDCTVRIHTEMGFGDVFLMVRYLPIMADQHNVKIILECPNSMLGLMKYNFPDIVCIPYGDAGYTDFDFHLPIMSLPYALHMFDVPWYGPYLKADEADAEEWSIKLIDKWSEAKNIGICWSSGRNGYNAANYDTFKRKSVPFDAIQPLLDLKNAQFHSLQVGLDEAFPNLGIKNFSDTAALIELMDIVITVDSAVANLAGAMGKEVWLMDRYDHDWRWTRPDWFPTVKVFRQEKPFEWSDVIERIKSELED